MKNAGFVLWLFALKFFVSNAQSCDSLSQAAFKQYGLGEFKRADLLYDQVAECDSVTNEDYYNAACVAAQLGNKQKSFHYLDQLTKKGYKDIVWITTDADLESLHMEIEWPVILEKIKQNYENYEKPFDRPLRKRILYMVEHDQSLRKSWGEVEKKYGKNSVQYDSIAKVIDQYRAKHSKELEEIYDQRGFPNSQQIGKDAVYNIWVLALHSLDIQFQKLSLFYLTEEAKAGNLDWEQIAMLADRIAFNEKEPQLFGTRFQVIDMSKRKVKLYSVKDINNLDNRRRALHLKPVIQGYADWGYELIGVPEQNK